MITTETLGKLHGMALQRDALRFQADKLDQAIIAAFQSLEGKKANGKALGRTISDIMDCPEVDEALGELDRR